MGWDGWRILGKALGFLSLTVYPLHTPSLEILYSAAYWFEGLDMFWPVVVVRPVQ